MSHEKSSSSSSSSAGAKFSADEQKRVIEHTTLLAQRLCLDEDNSLAPYASTPQLVQTIIQYFVHRQKNAESRYPVDLFDMCEYLLAEKIRGRKLLNLFANGDIPGTVDWIVDSCLQKLAEQERIAAACPKFARLSEVHEWYASRIILPPDHPDYVLRLAEELTTRNPNRVLIRMRIQIEGHLYVHGLEVEKDVPLKPIRPTFSLTDAESLGHRNFCVALAEQLVDEVLVDMAKVNRRHHSKLYSLLCVLLDRHVHPMRSEYAQAADLERKYYLDAVSRIVSRMIIGYALGAEGGTKDWLSFCELLRQQADAAVKDFPTSLRIRTDLNDFMTYAAMLDLSSPDSNKNTELPLAVYSKAALKMLLMFNGYALRSIIKTYFPQWLAKSRSDEQQHTAVVASQFKRALDTLPRSDLEALAAQEADQEAFDRAQEDDLRQQIGACMQLIMYKPRRPPITDGDEQKLHRVHAWYKQKVQRPQAPPSPALNGPSPAELQDHLLQQYETGLSSSSSSSE